MFRSNRRRDHLDVLLYVFKHLRVDTCYWRIAFLYILYAKKRITRVKTIVHERYLIYQPVSCDV